MKKVIALLIVVAAVVTASAAFTVDETEQVVVTRWGKPIRTIQDPGLHFKIPIVDDAISYDNRLLSWDGDPENMPTRDKKRIYVDVWARFHIVNPVKMLQSVGTLDGLLKKLDDQIDPAVRGVVGRHNLIEIVRTTNNPLNYTDADLQKSASRQEISFGRLVLEAEMLASVQSRGLEEEYGVHVVALGVKRINYPKSVRGKIYERMISERTRVAKLAESEGREVSDGILGDMAIELAVIEGEQQRKSARIRGTADAAVIRTWNAAIAVSPDFYNFKRTLDAYKESIREGSRVVLTTDSEFFKLLGGNDD